MKIFLNLKKLIITFALSVDFQIGLLYQKKDGGVGLD